MEAKVKFIEFENGGKFNIQMCSEKVLRRSNR